MTPQSTNQPSDRQLLRPQVNKAPQRRASDYAEMRVSGTAELGAVIALVLRQKWPMLIMFLLVFGSAVAYTIFKPPVYEAEMRIRLSGQGEATTANLDVAAGEVEILKSHSLLEELARKTGKGAKAVEEFDDAIKASPLTGTNLIQVKYRNGDAVESARVLNTLGELYVAKQKQLSQRPATAALYAGKLKQVESEWAAAQEELESLRKEASTPMLAEQRQSTVRRGSDLDSGIEEVRSQISENRDRLAAIQTQLAAQPAAVESGRRTAASSGLVDGLKTQLMQLETQRSEMLTKYDPSYRSVKQTEKQIATVREALDREQNFRVVERSESLNPLHQSLAAEKLRLEANLAGLRARDVALSAAAGRVKGKSEQLEGFAVRLEDLSRKAKLAEDTYMLFLKKEQEAQAADLAGGIGGMRASILEAAAIPMSPTRNHRSFVLALGFLAACFFAAAISIVIEYARFAAPHAIAAARIVQSAPIRVPLAGPGDAAAFYRKRLESPMVATRSLTLRADVEPEVIESEGRS